MYNNINLFYSKMNLYSKMKKNAFNIHQWLYIIPTIMLCYALASCASSTTNINYWYDGLAQPETPSLRGARRQYEILDDGPRINEIIERMRQVGVSRVNVNINYNNILH